MLGLQLPPTMAPALVMDAEAKGPLNPVFTTDLDTMDMVLALSDLVLLLTLAWPPLIPIGASKVSEENNKS